MKTDNREAVMLLALDALVFADQISTDWPEEKQLRHLREQIALARKHLESDPAEAMKQVQTEVERLTDTNKQFGKIIHNQVVANQAAWIEWQHGKGAEAAMVWVQNGLLGPGHIPDESEPWANDPQAYYDANNADPFPACHCGRPSNQLWMGRGACCDEHMLDIKRKVTADE